MSENIVSESKRCTKCGREYPATTEYFHRHKDKLKSHCKVCRAEESRKYASTERGHEVRIKSTRKWEATKGKEWHKQYSQTEVGVKMLAIARLKWVHENPEKASANYAVGNAVKAGKLLPIKECLCANCGNPAAHYHHWSYEPEYWLDVIPLCLKCHKGVGGVHRNG